MVPFAGWEMPVQYDGENGGIIPEHKAVRESCGVFDISHMGQFFVSGSSAESWLDGLQTNNVAKLGPGQAHYTFLLNERGGVIDDLIAYRLSDGRFLLIVNAAKIDEDAAWMQDHLDGAVTFEDASATHGAMAVQGPSTEQVFAKMFADAELHLPPRNGIASRNDLYVCRTGYTGEDGFELVCPAEQAGEWFDKAIAAGATPCGLGSRDSLRLEMGYPLNGSDLTPERTPRAAGLGFFVDLEKGDFIGRDALLAEKAGGFSEKLCAFKMLEKGPPPRPHYPVLVGDETIGEICSGGVSPSLGIGIGMAWLPREFSAIDTAIQIGIRGRTIPAAICRKPFYKKSTD